MIVFSFMTGKHRAIDICFFHKFRDFNDGVDWFEFHINSDCFRGDHNPRHDLHFAILNFTIIEIESYNIYHLNEDRNETF